MHIRLNIYILKRWATLTVCILLCCGQLNAAAPILFNPTAAPLNLRPYFGIFEDHHSSFSADNLIAKPELFTSNADLKITKPSNAFWLFTSLKSEESADLVLSFKHLTYAELYIMPDTPGAVYTKQVAGAFRPADQLSNGDSRFHFQVKLAAGITYRILIRSQHTKQYHPVFDFVLDDQHRFNKHKHQQELIDFWFQGAAIFLLLYVLISWLNTHFRPYLWLTIFIGGLMLYNLALSRYLIDWFFPLHPDFGWRLTIHFLHVGLAGLYLLILDFWKIREKSQKLYRYGKAFLFGIVILSTLSFLLHYYAANYKVMSQLNGVFLIIQFVYLLRLLTLWKSFDKQQRFLAYGVIIYISIALFVTVAIFVAGETIFSLFSILSGSILVTVSLLFLTGINGKLWQNEKEKSLYLSQLNQLQQQQNQLLEASVIERTRELNLRNDHIELLMNELNHRVKNNLQLLYSLNSLQLLGSKDEFAGNILKDNIARIKAMMLVNDSLNPENNTDNKTISPVKFITDIVTHSKGVFTQTKPIEINLQIEDTLVLDATAGLCLGLIVTELLTNSYKHAFSKQTKPQINIKIICTDEHWEMFYSDNGTGYLQNTTHSFGLTLIADLTRQLRGHYSSINENGILYSFTFQNQK